MDGTALCIHISMNLFVLLSTLPGQGYALKKPDFPIVFPDQLQFFEYQSVSVRCAGVKYMSGWKVMKKLHRVSPAHVAEGCSIPAPSCTINPTFESESGEYWCEDDKGERSHALNISFTVGSVILKYTGHPVKEGSDVNLQCINKNNEKAQITDFFKDGLLLKTHFENVLTLQNVSKSDEGLYKCSISGAGDSAESWLSVVKSREGSNEDTPVITTVLCTLGSLVLIVTGMVFFKKHKALKRETNTDLKEAMYAVVNKPMKRNDADATNTPDQVTYASVEMRKTGREVCTAPIGQYSTNQDTFYSLLTH